MKVADVGIFRWFFWALFSWQGCIKRLPFLIGFLFLVLFAGPYTNAAAQVLAVYFVPPASGAAPDQAYVLSLLRHPGMAPALLPIFYVYMALELKRLRSIALDARLCLGLSFLLAALSTYGALYMPSLLQPIAMTTFASHAILATIPAKEDRLHPLERKAKTWKAIATGDGTPRRLSGKDIKHWHVVPKRY